MVENGNDTSKVQAQLNSQNTLALTSLTATMNSALASWVAPTLAAEPLYYQQL